MVSLISDFSVRGEYAEKCILLCRLLKVLRRREKDLLRIKAALKWQKSSFTNLQALVVYLNMKLVPPVKFPILIE